MDDDVLLLTAAEIQAASAHSRNSRSGASSALTGAAWTGQRPARRKAVMSGNVMRRTP
jgi:hypothetical protein